MASPAESDGDLLRFITMHAHAVVKEMLPFVTVIVSPFVVLNVLFEGLSPHRTLATQKRKACPPNTSRAFTLRSPTRAGYGKLAVANVELLFGARERDVEKILLLH